MDLEISDNPSLQFFNPEDIKNLVQQSIMRGEKRTNEEFNEPENGESNKPTESTIIIKNTNYNFDSISKTIYVLDHQLLSTDQNAVEKSLIELDNFFEFLFENPSHKIKNGEIINYNVSETEIQRKVSIQSLNPIIARILDMFLNSKIFVFKNYIANILIRYAFVIKQVLIREELLQVLNKGMKGYDEYTRIISAKIIPSFIEMFEKDLIGFEYILHKIQSFNQIKSFSASYLVEKLSFTQCLKQMLEKSEVLSSFFIKNIKEEERIKNFQSEEHYLNINRMSILEFCEFCLHLKLNTSESLNLFKSILKIYKNRSKQIEKSNSEMHCKLKHYVSKLFQKSFDQNFKVLEAIYTENIEDELEIASETIQKKFKSFNPFQQQYILRDCPEKLKCLLNNLSEKSYKGKNLQKSLFWKFYEKINTFETLEDECQHVEDDKILKDLVLKERRLQEFLELCESLKQHELLPLIKIWLEINQIMLAMITKGSKEKIEKHFNNTKSLIQDIATKSQNLQDELFIAAEIFLLLEKNYTLESHQFFKQSFWLNSNKLPVENRHFLKWTLLSEKTLEKVQ